ncbi:hypothetical protein [Kangiella sp. HZ709]|uniref:hypothetical protein n=1 Tax=Kangiella sp. HZ709 TaxID=2666328 RepID=UPI0012AFC054|nr:hypothetical protein [Kangiella sp. HZ709]MRX27550.1 hypothetical protein [Kangiella sp. HZ709]
MIKPALAEKWLKALSIIHIVGGLLLPILVFSHWSDSYFAQIAQQFPDSNPESLRFLIGIFGPTLASWGLLFYFAVSKAFESLKQKDWWFLVAAILIWGVLDTSYSLYFNIQAHLYLNGFVILSLLLPLMFTRKYFLK